MVVPACAGQREQSRPGSLMHAGAGAGAVIVAAKAAEERTGASPTRRIPASKRRRGRWALLAVLVLSSCSDGFAFAPQTDMRSHSAVKGMTSGGSGSSCSTCGHASSQRLRFSGSAALGQKAASAEARGAGRAGSRSCSSARGERASVRPLSMAASTGAAKEVASNQVHSLDLAADNAKRLNEGDLSNLELVKGPGELQRRRTVLNQAYMECERITGIFAKTFYLGTKFMSPVARKAVWAIYVWCRRTDDIVDGPRAMVRGKKSMQQDLADWAKRLEDIWKGRPRDSLDLALVDVRESYPSLPIEPFKDMIDGMVMDVPGIGKNRYQTFEDLELYCYRVAGTVGLMVLPILGTAEGVSEEDAKFPALSLGIALQLTNILRDVGEDAVRGRIYLPLEDLEKFGVDPENIMNGILDSNYQELMKYQIARARFYYKQAARGIPMLSPEGRLPVQASLDMYGKILTAIENNGFDNFRKRAYISKTEKLLTLPFSYAKSLNPGKINLNIDESEFKLTRFDKLDMEREAFPTGSDDEFF